MPNYMPPADRAVEIVSEQDGGTFALILPRPIHPEFRMIAGVHGSHLVYGPRIVYGEDAFDFLLEWWPLEETPQVKEIDPDSGLSHVRSPDDLIDMINLSRDWYLTGKAPL